MRWPALRGECGRSDILRRIQLRMLSVDVSGVEAAFFFFFTDVRRETGASVYYFFPLLTFTCWMRYEHKFFVQIGLARTKQQLRPRPARGLKKTCGYETKARVYNPPPTPHRPEECGGPPDVYPRPFFAAGELIG